MTTVTLGRRTMLIAIAATLAGVVLAVVIVGAIAVWRLTEWGTTALDKATDAAVAAVEPLRQDAARVIEDSKGAVAATAAAVALTKEQATRELGDAKAAVGEAKARAAQAMTEPQAVLRDVTQDATQEATRALAAAAAAAAPAIDEGVDAATRVLDSSLPRDPEAWPKNLALRQVHYRRTGDVSEFSYLAVVPGFHLDALRKQLIEAGYEEHVIAQGEGSLEAVYRGKRQLLLSATTREDQQHIDVREVPLTVTDKAGP